MAAANEVAINKGIQKRTERKKKLWYRRDVIWLYFRNLRFDTFFRKCLDDWNRSVIDKIAEI